MEIRKTTCDDLETVIEIYAQARKFMRENGNPNQWINGYPTRDMIEEDIREGCSYVCLDEHQIVGVFRYTIGTDPTYLKIYEGSWLNEELYGVVHRIAVSSHKKGVASYCLNWCLNKCRNLRIDTHRDNHVMQNMLKKNGFSYCGIIYLEDGDERLAFQKCKSE